MKRIRLSLLFILFSVSVLSANSTTDTLTRYANEDEARQNILLLLELAETNRSMNPEKALFYALSAIKISEETSNYELWSRAEYLAGFAHYVQNDFSEAIEHFEKSLELSENHKLTERKAAALNRLGNTYQLMGQYEQALKFYQQALTINKDLDNQLEIARNLTNLGSIYRLFGNYELAINQHLEALGIYEGLQNNEGIAWSALNIARLFKMMKNYEKSIEYINQSLDIYQSIEEENRVRVGVTLCLKEFGDVYYEMGDFDQAVEYTNRVLRMNRQSGNKLGVANSLSMLGKIYFDAGEYNNATSFLDRAKALKDSLNDYTETATILRYLGKINLIKGEVSLASKNLKNSLHFALQQNLKEEVKESYLALSELYEKTGNTSRALEYYKLYTGLKDSLNNQKINELELQYEFDKMQRQAEFEQKQKDAEQKARLQKQKIYTWVFVVGFVFLFIFSVFIYKSYQRKKRTNIMLTRQKEEIETQKDEIEAQRDFVTRQRDQIAHQNEIITDSIEYAKRIQSALLPQDSYLEKILARHFVFMKPKNIVSGDFFWVTEKHNKTIVAVADCTGHGVPGAFMSMLGVAFLNEIVNNSSAVQPHLILNKLRNYIIESLHQEYGYSGSKDGMDMALITIDKSSLAMEYAGAYNPVFIIRNGKLHEIKGDKMPIGIHAVKVDKEFTSHQYQLQKQDVLYLFSDGYVDQFGGKDGMKLKMKPFKELLVKISREPMDKQQKALESYMEEWQGDYSQLDDMIVMGVGV
ncbi:MAG: tetratricopeptide repeat protein [Bacteroidales bacterium]|jgi:serine phosphatase RsbU (regulator of sigma subunit)|nr:tetratricopeptide repeat protein [Bacteroidales bacterium]